MSIEAMKQALEALERAVSTCFDRRAHEDVMSRPEHFINQTITALRIAIAEAESVKPIAWANINKHGDITHTNNKRMPWSKTPLYTTPPAAQQKPVAWLGLEPSDMPDGDDPMYDHDFFIKGMVWADAILRKKNDTPPAAQQEPVVWKEAEYDKVLQVIKEMRPAAATIKDKPASWWLDRLEEAVKQLKERA
jgi:hypothetical protein